MGLPATPFQGLTPKQYFSLSAESEERLEYDHGEIVAMGTTTDTHSELVLNLSSSLKRATRGRGCKVYAETVPLEVEADARYYLPDVMMTCDERDHQNRKLKKYPNLVAEVISPSSIQPSSVQRDREVKFRAYLALPTVKYYLLLNQDRQRVEVFGRMESGKGWAFNFYEKAGEIIELDQLGAGVQLQLDDIYEEVTLVSPVDERGEADD